MVGTFQIGSDGDGTASRASARHWTAVALDRHRAMGFEAGWARWRRSGRKFAKGQT